MKNHELLSLLKQKNKIEMPVLTANDVVYVIVQKSSLEEYVKALKSSDRSPWEIVGEKDGVVTLDLAD